VPIVLKYGSLNLLELSGPVQACGIALPLSLSLINALTCKNEILLTNAVEVKDLSDMVQWIGQCAVEILEEMHVMLSSLTL
jgi:hypothetical protein